MSSLNASNYRCENCSRNEQCQIKNYDARYLGGCRRIARKKIQTDIESDRTNAVSNSSLMTDC
jgi:hypothetical protein